MSMFSSSGGGGLFSTRKDDEEVSLPLYNTNENRSSGFLAASNAPTSRSPSPRPLEIRIPRPSTPIGQFQPPIPQFIRRGWRFSWQNVLLVVLGLYTLVSLFRGPNYREVEPTPAEYDGGTPRKDITHLVMVAGHAIWMGGNTLGESEKEWTLLSYQSGLTKTFKQHIEKGVKIAEESEDSLLVFSGGETRKFAGPSSEAQSYWITVIGFEFKRERFENVHRAAIRFPHVDFNYIGIDPTDNAEQLAKFAEGEKEGPLKQFQEDPHVCLDQILVSKRKGRNPFRTRHGYEVTSTELKGLLRWCTQPDSIKDGKAQLYPGVLPWSKGL
ncbi:hypothetical protein ABW19_dt0207800 [Dactylella cylindrospora]|nr:hypothetical protein ABW19_dt0207800 [Dactylella cylindrospora]